MKRRVIVSAAVLVGVFAIAVVLRPTHNQPKATRHTDKSILAASTSPQAEKSIFSILGSVSPALAPSVTTDPATNLAFTSATLNGTVLMAGSSPITTRGFEYGPTDSYGSTTTENVPGSYDYVSKWGSNVSSDGELTNPSGTAIDSSGNIFVADTYNNRIQKFNSSGVYQSQFGSYGSGNGELYRPIKIVIDSLDNLYISDSYNNRIQKFNSSGVYQSHFGSNGSGDGQFEYQNGIAIDSSGNIFVADTNNHRIQKFNSSGVYQSQFGSPGSGNGQLAYPRGVAIDLSGNIYVTDSNNNRIQKFNSSGVYQSKFGTGGSGNGQFNQPQGIVFDSLGNIYVTDLYNNRIQKFNSSGVYQSQFGSYGSGTGQFNQPEGIAIDSSGNIFVADTNNHRIQKFNSSAVYTGEVGYNPTQNGLFNTPKGIAIDSSGNIFVADTNNHRIQKFNSSGVYQSQFGSYGSGNGQFNQPQGIVFDSLGNIYVTDSYNYRIQKFNSSGVYQSQFGSFGTGTGQFNQPQGIAIDSSGQIFVSDPQSNRIQKFNSSGVYQSQFGSFGTGNGQLDSPQGIAIDAFDNIYILENGNNRVQKFNSSGVYQSQFGSFGGVEGSFYLPQGIATDSSGNVYVADTQSHRVQKFNSSGVYQSKFGSYGSGDGQFFSPQGIATDSSGNVYVADTQNHRIQMFTVSMQEGVFNSNLTDLACNRTYHYRAYASNSEDTIEGDDATFTTAACPNPDPPTNLQAMIRSSTAIDLSWDAPLYTGDSPISYYKYGYRLIGGNDYIEAGTSYTTTATVTGLEPSTEYELIVVAFNENGNHDFGVNDVPTPVTATTGTPGLNLISTCQQLQDIQNNLGDNYELARNIDCSDTINWNGGAGFVPIGDIFNQVPFSGILAGNNYSITDLYINQSGGEYAVVAPFGLVSKALIHDVRIVRPVVMGSAHDVVYASGLIAALFQDGGSASSVVNVHITDAQVRAELDSALPAPDNAVVGAGGLVAFGEIKNTTQPPQHSKNEFVGSIDVSGPAKMSYAGGLYSSLFANDFVIQNSYATADITVDNSLVGAGHTNQVGGLVGSGEISIDRSYAAGSISVNDDEPAETSALGGIGGAIGQRNVSNSFARVSITNVVPAVAQATGGFIGGFDNNSAPTLTNNTFDADVAGTPDCSSPLLDPLSGCTAISGQPNYFYNNSTNPPLNSWDFTNIWNTTSTLPVFDKKVLTTITAIPPERLAGALPKPTLFPQASDAPTIGPVVPLKLSLRTFGEKFLPPADNTPTSLIEQLKRFFKNVPAVVLVAFPYAFFGLLLMGALGLLVEVWLQAKRLRATKLLIARQEAVAKERDTFWHLAANYLRAPITLMVGGIELLSDDKFPGVAKLQLLSANLQTKVGTIMDRIEDSKSLQDIARPKAEAPKRVLSLVRFWAPVVAVGMLAVTMNVVATSYRNINLSYINLGMQVMIFVIVSLLLYWVLGALGVVKSKRKQAEALLKRQTTSLDGARSEFIAQSATDLDKDLTQLQHELDGMHTKAATGKAAAGTAAAMAIVAEGTHRLRELIDSFELLVAAQNNKLSELSPQNARTDLHSIVGGALVPLQPVITEKHLTVHTGTMNNMVVPGNSLLLNQVVGSVLANAVAFSPAGNTIDLSLKHTKDSVELVVTNQGTPISKDEISHVFSPLTRADGYDGLQLDHDGLGVNLYIDKLIMQHLGGGIHVASSATKGTTLTMQWPVTQAG